MAKDALMMKYGFEKPYFDSVDQVRPTSYYRETPLVENVHISRWMEKECISTGEYGYTRGNRETVYKGTSKYRFDEPKWKEEAFAKAWSMVKQRWSIVPKTGLADDFECWIDMTTSPGYPYNIDHQTKKDVLKDEETMAYMRYCFDEVYCNGMWSVRCKTEPTKLKKLEEYNGRVIVSAPMDVQVAGVRLFGPMNNQIYHTARQHKIPCTVGMTKYYRGWHHLYQRMTRMGKFLLGLELDYTNFDGTCTVREFEQLMNVRFSLLKPDLQTDQMKNAFQRYYREIVWTKMILDCGEVVMKMSGNPSGQVNTIVDNSIINEFRWYYAWCCLMPEEYHNLAHFAENAELITCGDDSLLTVKPGIENLFKPQEIFSLFADHGWKPKFASSGWQPIYTLNYCSQSFRWLNGWVVPAPNNYQKMLASLKWGGNRRDARETLGRLLGIKIESYFLAGFRSCLDRLISQIFEKYYLQLKQTPRNLDEFTYDELCILNRDYSAAYGLYLGSDGELDHVFVGPVEKFSDAHLNDVL